MMCFRIHNQQVGEVLEAKQLQNLHIKTSVKNTFKHSKEGIFFPHASQVFTKFKKKKYKKKRSS